ncbi:MAG: hypothetical protein EXX96DRAFT_345487 [Benjaminiella poitrasii]|nr:MAG: hypothetical protein EXX96DRAFT_345487 [Benjaminiella poitrasii]
MLNNWLTRNLSLLSFSIKNKYYYYILIMLPSNLLPLLSFIRNNHCYYILIMLLPLNAFICRCQTCPSGVTAYPQIYTLYTYNNYIYNAYIYNAYVYNAYIYNAYVYNAYVYNAYVYNACVYNAYVYNACVYYSILQSLTTFKPLSIFTTFPTLIMPPKLTALPMRGEGGQTNRIFPLFFIALLLVIVCKIQWRPGKIPAEALAEIEPEVSGAF